MSHYSDEMEMFAQMEAIERLNINNPQLKKISSRQTGTTLLMMGCEKRMDIIGSNTNDGLHYAEVN